MNRSRFSQKINTANRKPSGMVMLAQILILGLVITILAAIFVQNLQPTVQIVFLGQKSIAIPLSVSMLVAFAIGGIIALIINAIASWRQNLLIRRAVIAADDADDILEKDKPTSTPKPPPVTYNNIPKDKKENKKEDKKEESYLEDDWETEDDDDEYEDIGDEYEDDEEYVNDDPDTVPYGDLLKLKSNPRAKTSQETKCDRPPLDVKFTRYTK